MIRYAIVPNGNASSRLTMRMSRPSARNAVTIAARMTRMETIAPTTPCTRPWTRAGTTSAVAMTSITRSSTASTSTIAGMPRPGVGGCVSWACSAWLVRSARPAAESQPGGGLDTAHSAATAAPGCCARCGRASEPSSMKTAMATSATATRNTGLRSPPIDPQLTKLASPHGASSRLRRASQPAGRRSMGRSYQRGWGRLEQLGELALGLLAPRRDVLTRQPTFRLLVVAEHVARHRLAVHLVGAVVDAGGAGVAVHRLQRQVAGVAPGAVDLDGAVDHVVQDLRPVELDQP